MLERNLRSGDKLEPADVETKTMQYLYADADSFIFMDTTTYDQVNIPKETVGDSADYMPENINVEVLFFNGRAVDVSLPNFIEQPVIEADPGFRGDTATGATKPAKISTGATSTCRCSSASATSSRSTRAPGSTSSASAAPEAAAAMAGGARDAGGARPHPARGPRLVRGAGLPRGRHAGARPLARAGGPPRRRCQRATATG